MPVRIYSHVADTVLRTWPISNMFQSEDAARVSIGAQPAKAGVARYGRCGIGLAGRGQTPIVEHEDGHSQLGLKAARVRARRMQAGNGTFVTAARSCSPVRQKGIVENRSAEIALVSCGAGGRHPE